LFAAHTPVSYAPSDNFLWEGIQRAKEAAEGCSGESPTTWLQAPKALMHQVNPEGYF